MQRAAGAGITLRSKARQIAGLFRLAANATGDAVIDLCRGEKAARNLSTKIHLIQYDDGMYPPHEHCAGRIMVTHR